MQRLTILESHVTASAVVSNPALTGHIYDKYKKMSKVEPEFIQRLIMNQGNFELFQKLEGIFKDK
jgi:hypothetical protein